MSDIQQAIREAISAAIAEYVGEQDLLLYLPHAERIVAKRFPQACQTCKGSGNDGHSHREGEVCRKTQCFGAEYGMNPCADCPTLGTLLEWGVRVALATVR